MKPSAAITSRYRYDGHSSARPYPLRKTGRTISRKCRIGFAYVMTWKTSGMVKTGNMKPLSRMAGMKKRNMTMSASWRVRASVEMRSPNESPLTM